MDTAVGAMRERKLDILTLMPQVEFGSFWERAVQPVIFRFIASLTRFKNVNDQDHESAMGFGAFLMFRRSAYEKIGGHKAGKADVLEDVLIAKRAKKAGLELLVEAVIFHSNVFWSQRNMDRLAKEYVSCHEAICATSRLVCFHGSWFFC